jgi:glutamate carboxypeptidase
MISARSRPEVAVRVVRFVLPAFLSLAFATLVHGLDPTETDLVASVEAHAPEAAAFLEDVVNVNSGTMNVAGVREVGRRFEPRFRSLGFDVRWVDGGASSSPDSAGDAGKRPRILLIGHLDTVFEADSPFQTWTTLPDSLARAPGAADMKGGIVVMLLALQALQDAGRLDDLEIRVVLTGDEENAGEPLEKARADLIDAAEWADIALGFEDGDGDPRTAVISRRGASTWELRTTGVPAHSSVLFSPDVGSGAIYELARILTAFHDSLSAEEYLTFNPGVVAGGTTVDYDATQHRGTAFGKFNVVAEGAVAAGDLRALSPEQRSEAQATMQRIVDRHLPRTEAELVFRDAYPPLAPTDGNRRLLALYDQASRDLGLGPVTAVDPAKAGAADISFTSGRVDGAMDGLGLLGTGGHTVNETADLRTLRTQAGRMALLLSRLAGDR